MRTSLGQSGEWVLRSKGILAVVLLLVVVISATHNYWMFWWNVFSFLSRID